VRNKYPTGYEGKGYVTNLSSPHPGSVDSLHFLQFLSLQSVGEIELHEIRCRSIKLPGHLKTSGGKKISRESQQGQIFLAGLLVRWRRGDFKGDTVIGG
jgi:hypothetical protein